jgi:hypothetical protein
MKLVPEIIDRAAHKEFRRFLEITGRGNWERKIAKLNSLPLFPSPSPNAYFRYLANRNPLVEYISRYLELERQGKLLRKHATPEMMKACGYLKVINALCHQCGSEGASRLLSIVNDDETFRSFLFELDMAIHFSRRGYDVEFVDLRDLGRFDLLVSDGETELELECKTKSVDAGRKITRPNFYLLCDVLAADLAPLTKSFAILFKCDGRLSGDQEIFHAVAHEIRASQVAPRLGQVDTLHFEVRDLPSGVQIRTDEEAAAALGPHFAPAAHYLVLSDRETLIIGCESTDRNRVLRAIYDDLKRGAGQFSKTRPSLLACQLEDIEDSDWKQLQGETGLAAMTARVLESSDRRHVNFVVYSSDRTPPLKDYMITSFSATNLWFSNSAPTFSLPMTFLNRSPEQKLRPHV